VKNLIEKQRFTDEEGNHFDKYFDAVGNLRREVKFLEIPEEDFPPNSLITDYNYDSLYRVTQVRTPNGLDITYSYDGFGRQSKRTTPDAGRTDFYYDKNNNLIYSQDANQRSSDNLKYIFKNYDGLNRLTGTGETILLPSDSPEDGIQYQPTTPTEYFIVNVYDTISKSIIPNFFNGVYGYTSTLNYTKGNLAATSYRTRKNEGWSFKYYRYDERGRVIRMWNLISGFDTLITDYKYNSQDQVTEYSHILDEEAKIYKNDYDYSGRLSKVTWYIPPPDAPVPFGIELIRYQYNQNSQVSQQILRNGITTNSFNYDNRNRISSVANSYAIFSYTNTYFKNGNVKTQNLTGNYNDNFQSTADLNFNYTYDKSNRLLNSSIGTGNSYGVENTYDNAGNILTLKRKDRIGKVTDDFSFAYYPQSNKLMRVQGASGIEFRYDNNGNMTQDSLNRNDGMLYDYRNLPIEIYHRSGDSIYNMT
jgi:YD repeat-containing protein